MRYEKGEKKTQQKIKGENTCLTGRMGDHVLSGEERRTEEGGRSKKRAEELGVPEGEEYWSEGEDGRPCIKCRERKTGRGIKEKIEKTRGKREEN